MKKSIIALMGLFTLFACSDEVIESVERSSDQSESNFTTFSEDNNLPFGYVYESPYKFFSGGICQVDFKNESLDVRIELWPIFANGYWDGGNDLVVTLNNGGIFPQGTNLSTALPNIFGASNEYTVEIHADPIIMSPNSGINYGDLSSLGFPVFNTSSSTNIFTFNSQAFSNDELNWIKHYSKLHGVKYKAFDNITGAFLADGLLLANFYPGASSNGVFTNPSNMPNWNNMNALFSTGAEQYYITGYLEVMTAHYDGFSDIAYIKNYVTGSSYKFSFTSTWDGIKIVLN